MKKKCKHVYKIHETHLFYVIRGEPKRIGYKFCIKCDKGWGREIIVKDKNESKR